MKNTYYQQACTTRNNKRSSSGRREMIADRNLNLQVGMKNIRNGKYLGKYKSSISF